MDSEALVCLQSSSVPIHPRALVADLSWEEVEEGAPVTASRGELSVGRFVLPLAEAEVVDLTFHPPKSLVSLQKLQERLALIERLLAETPDPFESEFDRAFVRDRILAGLEVLAGVVPTAGRPLLQPTRHALQTCSRGLTEPSRQSSHATQPI